MEKKSIKSLQNMLGFKKNVNRLAKANGVWQQTSQGKQCS